MSEQGAGLRSRAFVLQGIAARFRAVIANQMPYIEPVRKPLYGNFDGQASRFDGWREAWVSSEDRTSWKEISSASHDHAVREISKAEFDRKFPDIPPLPPQAFSGSS